MMKKLRVWWFMMWRPILAFLVITLVFASVLGFQLGALTKNSSSSEKTYIASVNSGKKLLENPIFVVHKLPIYGLQKLKINNLAVFRSVSALFATLATVSLFFILREWYTDRVALLGSVLFLTSAWTLHIGRLATPESSYLLILPLVWAVVWLYNTTLRKTGLILLSGLAALSFYIPGFGILVIVAAALKHKLLWKELKRTPRWFWAICGLVITLVLSPLAWAGIGSGDVLVSVIGLPQKIPSLQLIWQNLADISINLFARGPHDPVRWLGRLPMLDAFASAMVMLGIYSLRYHVKLVRVQLLGVAGLIIILLIALGGPVTITAMMPFIYILVAAGMAFMLQQWFTVFPGNPFARTLATTVLSTLVLLVGYYHITHYFIAWPQAPETKAVFTKNLVK